MLNSSLRRLGIRSTDFHSEITQNRRKQLLDKFREGRLNVLIATDVAARVCFGFFQRQI
jgi:superfamily II DNA/RNA helicase